MGELLKRVHRTVLGVYLANALLKRAVVGLLVSLTFCCSYAQAQPKGEDFRFNDRIRSCDDSVALQDITVTHALDRLREDAVMIVLMRPGSDSTDRLLERRLFNVRQYFRDRGNRIAKEKVLIAVSAPVDGNSRLEYYINGEVSMRLIYPPGSYICHSCCGPDPNYYPDKKSRTKQKKH